jgi:hypothetical protein
MLVVRRSHWKDFQTFITVLSQPDNPHATLNGVAAGLHHLLGNRPSKQMEI